MSTMLYPIALLLLAGYISDGQGPSFLAAAFGIVLAEWSLRLGPLLLAMPRLQRFVDNTAKQGGAHRFLILDPHTLDPAPLREAFHHMLDEVRRLQQPMVLRLAPISPRARFRPLLQLNRQGNIEITGCEHKETLMRPDVWIADHPLPLPLPTSQCTTFTFTPCSGDRVRVHASTACSRSKKEFMLLGLLLGCAWLLDYHAFFSALFAFTLHGTFVPAEHVPSKQSA